MFVMIFGKVQHDVHTILPRAFTAHNNRFNCLCIKLQVITELRSKEDPNTKAILKQIVPRWKDDLQARERLKHEADVLTKLNKLCAKVPLLYDSFVSHEGAEPFIVMEYIHGIRFDEWLKSTAPVSPHIGVKITIAIADTIRLCHSQNVGHRDLKPANIILKNDDVASPYVLDFGISFDSQQTFILTKDGEMFWNEFIMLPECQDLGGGHRECQCRHA